MPIISFPPLHFVEENSSTSRGWLSFTDLLWPPFFQSTSFV